MKHKIYLGYKVYEDGSVENKKLIKLLPHSNGLYSYYIINGKSICSGRFVLFAFEIYPKNVKQRVIRKDGNIFNNSLDNLSW